MCMYTFASWQIMLQFSVHSLTGNYKSVNVESMPLTLENCPAFQEDMMAREKKDRKNSSQPLVC